MLLILLLVINRLSKTEFSIFIPLMQSLLQKDLTDQNLFIFTAAGVVSCGGPYIIMVQIIFSGPLGSLSSFVII